MRHRKNKLLKFAGSHNQRRALVRSLVSAVILRERIFTTEGKAKKIKPFLERTITRAKKNDLNTKRALLKDFTPRIVDKLLKEIGPRYANQAGGYSRMLKTNPRKDDAAKMVLLELVKK